MNVKNWKPLCNIPSQDVDSLQNKFNLPRPIAVYFAARGIKETDVPGFLEPRLGNLSDPYRFPGIREACARLW